RSGAAALTPPLVSAVLASKDHVAALLATALGAPPPDPAIGPSIVAQLEALTAAARASAPGTGAAPAPAPVPAPEPDVPELRVDYLVTFTLSPDLAQLTAADLQPGALPEGLVDELRALGACIVLAGPSTTGDAPGAPPVWQFVVTTSQGEDAIHD